MIYGLLSTKSILVFIILLLIIYYKKVKKMKRITTPSKVYIICVQTETIHYITQILALYTLKFTGQNIIYNILYVIHFISAIIVLATWIMNIRATIDGIEDKTFLQMAWYNIETKVATIGVIISFIAMLIPPINKLITDIPQDNIVMYTDAFLLTLIPFLLICMYPMALVFKHRKKLTKEYKLGQAISMTAVTISVIVQIMAPNFAVIQYGIIAVMYSYYFLFENPDIIIRKEMELLNKDKDNNTKLLSNITEDIKVPITNMLNSCDELRLTSTYNPKLVEENIKKINIHANRFIDMTNNIIESSQTSSDSLKINDRKYETKDLIKNIMNYATEKIGEKKIKLIFKVSPTISKVLYGDYAKLYQSISNIISYACLNTEIGKLTINIYSQKEVNIENINIEIFDTGQGLKEEEQIGLFASNNESGEKYDAIFLDIEMPEINGIDTLKVINHLGESQNTKIFALTANYSSVIKEEYLSKGFDEFIEKPIKDKKIENILRQHFSN